MTNQSSVRGATTRLRAPVMSALTIAALLFLTACTAAPSDPNADPDPAASASASSAPDSSDTGSSDDASTDTDADAAPFDADAAVQTALDAQWEQVVSENPTAVRPDIDLIRYVESDEWAPVMESCMHDLGWPDSKATPDGGLEWGTLQNSQAGAHALAMYTCTAKYPMDPKYSIPLTDQQLSDLYDYFADELQPCLEAEGYETPDAPSRETFIESYTETGGWNLYENVAGRGGQVGWYEINEKCPQVPESFSE